MKFIKVYDNKRDQWVIFSVTNGTANIIHATRKENEADMWMWRERVRVEKTFAAVAKYSEAVSRCR